MSLYTKYRPKDWDSVIGQEYITTILRNSLSSGRIHHAYLFHGSRGTWKTTSARILAKWVNCLDLKNGNPCHTCIHCQAFDNGTMLDVIEIDAASNTSVENIRDVIEKARFEPNQGKYKIYIIDEVHMLSTGAFNALLKTLEEPPPHVKFILATTETEKVPETIRSRTLRFDFRKISVMDIIKRLEFICKEEWIRADESALNTIAKSARWGLRDALTLLEQNNIDQEVTIEHVRYTLSLLEDSLIDEVINSLLSRNVEAIVALLEKLKDRHIQARSFFEQMLYSLRDHMMSQMNESIFYEYQEIFELIESAYTKVRYIPDSMMLIEITLLKTVKRNPVNSTQNSSFWIKTPTPKLPTSEKILPIEEKREKIIAQEVLIKIPEPKTPPKIEEIKEPRQLHPSNQEKVQPFSFPMLITHFKEVAPALASDLKMARFQESENTLTLIFSKKWNHDRVNLSKTKNLIIENMTILFGGDWNVECRLQEGVWWLNNIVDEVF